MTKKRSASKPLIRLPVFLGQLIRQFERNEEAKKFIITPPPNAGFVYEFNAPYFQSVGCAFTHEKPSMELMTLCFALRTAYLHYVARREAELAASYKPRPGEKVGYEHELVAGMFNAQSEDIRFRLPQNNYVLQYGLMTKLGVFPIATKDEIEQLKRIHATRAAEILTSRVARSTMIGDSVSKIPETPLAKIKPIIEIPHGSQ